MPARLLRDRRYTSSWQWAITTALCAFCTTLCISSPLFSCSRDWCVSDELCESENIIVLLNLRCCLLAETLKSYWPALLAAPAPAGTRLSSSDTVAGIDHASTSLLSFLHTIHEVAPGEFVLARDKYRLIAAY